MGEPETDREVVCSRCGIRYEFRRGESFERFCPECADEIDDRYDDRYDDGGEW